MAGGCNRRYERAAEREGYCRVAGVDEVGRGALFGPVVVAAVILDPTRRIHGLNDSKKLTPERREELAEKIHERALVWGVAERQPAHIDAWNIYQATRHAMTEAILNLNPEADYVLSDAMPLDLPVPCQPLIKGDNRSISIAAASIIAKVHRDALLREWDREFPEYGLAQHKGYATKLHLERLERHGPTPLHRRSFRPVREQIALPHLGEQEPLPFHPGRP